MHIKNILSLFDGASCGQIALNRSGINYENYFASEIDKYAIKVTRANYPNTIQLGDINNININDLPNIDLVLAGSPCQGFSFAGKQLAFDDPRSNLFFKFLEIWNKIKAKNPNALFLFENVKMKKEYELIISKYLNISPIEINSALLSAQARKRLYWTNIPGVTIPNDKNVLLKDILEDLPDCNIGTKVREKSNCIRVGGRNSPFGSKQVWDTPFQRITKKGKLKPDINKSNCITGGANSAGNHSDMDIIHTPFITRRYSVTECEKLQTMPVNYTNYVSNSQRYKIIGNGWTVDVIAHILSFINKN